MKTYYIDPETGRGCKPKTENALTLHLMDKAEFSACKDPLPHRGALLRAMERSSLRSCRAESYARCVLGTMTLPDPKGKPRGEMGLSFGFYLQAEIVYLVEGGSALAEAVNRVRQGLPDGCRAGDILLGLFNQLLEQESDRLMGLSDALDQMEERLLSGLPKNFYQTLLRQQRQLSRLHAYYQQLIDVGEEMEDAVKPVLGEDSRDSWQRYTNRAARLHDYAETLREHLVQLRELYQAQIEAAQNRTMTWLTVVTTLFLPLTLIAGWYGMNFAYMPELQSPYGYIGVIALSVGIVIAEIVWFKHKKML